MLFLRYLKYKPTIYFFLHEKELSDAMREYLCHGETALVSFTSVRDEIAFTDKRILILDRRGFSGKKIRMVTIPYKSITFYKVGLIGGLDPDAEILLNLRGNVKIQIRFLRSKEMKESIHKAYETITHSFICGEA